jgi:CRISPR-associated protein Cas4
MHRSIEASMDDIIIFSFLNDFIFCPASIYFHNLYGSQTTISYQTDKQINGTASHKTIDENTYSNSRDIITALEVYSQKYNIVGKIDMYSVKTQTLTERKRQIKTIYDGYIFQLYAQYFGMSEHGYDVKKLQLHSMIDNKTYTVNLPENDSVMLGKFEKLISDIRSFDMEKFKQTNVEKCRNCIYEPACDRGLV